MLFDLIECMLNLERNSKISHKVKLDFMAFVMSVLKFFSKYYTGFGGIENKHIQSGRVL